ncbi:aspartate/glutamate racemase family protein [Streptobacillus felis]|uniref:Aspartate/glutamate racemase family protein n=1 Tax=Streptobacillus felis TaxID=1384509 RepID=A0A7Z0TAL7_9FUSO|nr:aspartate/glutamate racemase family protein [Streptobacillus felis]NYV28147.1 aspartate/glutamate racemase family protein [Streptobacillus felis]
MKTIGLIGGMSWESTLTYYKLLNDKVMHHLGGLNSAKIILYSVNFADIEKCQKCGDWNKSAEILKDAALKLEKAGADFVLICTNTMHKVVPEIQKDLNIPIIHIAEATADVLVERGIKKVALLGTKYTMTQDFYREKLTERGIEVLIPCEHGVEFVNDVIFKELCVGEVKKESKDKYVEIINGLVEKGAEGVILGCTEIDLLIKDGDVDVPVFDTTEIHADKAFELAIK